MRASIMARARLLLVDDHALFRAGLRLLLAEHARVGSIAEAGSLDEAAALAAGADLALLDVNLPGLNGLEGITLLRAKAPHLRVLMLSAVEDPAAVQLARVRGAQGFVSKAAPSSAILAAVDAVLDGGSAFAQEPGAPAGAAASLTGRQLEVLALLCEGRSNKLIGRALDLSENTVRVHVSAILRALDSTSRTEAMVAARQRGLVR